MHDGNAIVMIGSRGKKPMQTK